MKILIALNHPAHYYLFKYIIEYFIKKKYSVEIVIKDKDILEKILIEEKKQYTKINKRKKEKKIFSLLY